MDKKVIKPINTPEFRVSFPNLFVPTRMKDSPTQPLKYSIQMLISKKVDITALRQLAFEAGVAKFGDRFTIEKFGPKVTEWPKGVKCPIRDGQEFVEADTPRLECAGMWVIAARNEMKPGVVDADVVPIIDAKAVYGGSYGIAQITAFGFDKGGSKGVAFSLLNYQKSKDGEPFGAPRPAATDAFKAVAGGQAEDGDPLA